MIKDMFGVAVRNILHRKRRSLLTIVGVFIGITAVVALVSLGQGLQSSVEQEFEQIGSDKLFINSAGSTTGTSDARLDDTDLRAVRGANSVEEAEGLIFATTTVKYNDQKEFGSLIGTRTGESLELLKESWALEIAEGRDIRQGDSGTVVVGHRIAELKFEDDVPLRASISINGEDFRLVGVYEETGDPAIDQALTMPYSEAADLIGRGEDDYDYIIARAQSGFTPEEAKAEVETELRRERGVEKGEESFAVSTNDDLLESFNQILAVVSGVVIGIASISLVVGGVNIMNTMYASVTQRTREIGVMKAIGASKRQILTIFLLEAGIIGTIGGVLGVLSGIGLSSLASYAATQAVSIPISPYLGLDLILGSILFSFVVGLASGFLPARSAANLPPAEALQYE